MRPQDIVLWAAAAAALSAAIASALAAVGQGDEHYRRAQRLCAAAAWLLAAALGYLASKFLLADVDLAYVHQHVRAGAPVAYRVAGLWGGREGTLLLWAFFACAALSINARAWRRLADAGRAPPAGAGHPLPWMLAVGSLLVAAFTVLVVAADPFRPTDALRLQAEPGGRGLQPILETPFMVLHPPLQFLAYGLAVLLFAAAMAYLITGRREWADAALPWARGALLVSWVGLTLGALWAYYVLNFGGYWAWDPVETANLLAFLPLVPLVHALIYTRKRGTFAVMAPLFAVLAFLSTLFSSLATRTGLWVSVHAFTDPTQTFARDPLRRLLDILAADAQLGHMVRLFLVAGAAAAVAALRRQADPATPAWLRGFGVAAAAPLGAFAAVALVDPGVALGALFAAADAVPGVSAPAGLGLVAILWTLAASLPTLLLAEPAGAPRPWEDRLSLHNMVFVGMLLVALAYLGVFLVDVTTVNGYDRTLYDDRAPLVAVPFLAVLGFGLGSKTLGWRRSAAWAAAAVAGGAALAVAWPDLWTVLASLPVGLYALHGACVKWFKVSDAGRGHVPARLRVVGAVLLLGGAAALVWWSNPPSRVGVGALAWRPHPWWAAVGWPLGLAAIAGAVATLRADHWRLSVAGGLALAASGAWLVGVPLGVWAAYEAAKRRRVFEHGKEDWSWMAFVGRRRRDLRKTGVYLVHVALVVGMAGYATSTYLAEPEQLVRLEPDRPVEAHGYTFTLVGSATAGVDPSHQWAEEVHALVAVEQDGRLLGHVPLTMWLELPAHYAERVTVERGPWEDLYLRPLAMTTTGPQGETTFQAHDDGVGLFAGTQVVAVDFTARTLPGMHLVWGGAWMLAAGALVAIVFGGWRPEPSRPVS